MVNPSILTRIDELIHSDPGARGLASAAGPNDLYGAGALLARSSRLLLATGFYVRACNAGETDGPTGTAVLAATAISAGKSVAVVTDCHSSGLVARALAVHGLSVHIHEWKDSSWPAFGTSALPPCVGIFEIPVAPEPSRQALGQLMTEYAPDCVVSIERPGSAAGGSRYTMRGDSLDDVVPAFEPLLEAGIPCIAVGDGGNELGMGSLPVWLRESVPLGERIFASLGADIPVVAGVSNWGGWALAAALALSAGGAATLPDPRLERAALEAIVAAGAVDGALKVARLGVDGLELDVYLDIIITIHAAWKGVVQ